MRIGILDGSITFSSGQILRGTDREEFLRTLIGSGAKEEIVNEQKEWRQILVNPESGIAATLIFQARKLHQVFLSMKMPSDDRGDWTNAAELERKAMHDAWLRSEFGAPPYEYEWGTVSSEFDAKGCASEIIVSYAQ